MANREQLEKLKEGVAAWNQWRTENPDLSIDLMKADLRDVEYPGIDFGEANLSRANFRDAILTGADLSLAVLTGANLTGAKLTNADLSGASGENVQFFGVDASDADLSEAVLKGHFNSASFVAANLSGGVFTDSTFDTSDLTGSNLTGTDFRDSNLGQVNFSGASLEGANLKRCDLESASFKYANLSKANMRDVSLSNADLLGAILTEADIRGARGLTCDRLMEAKDWETTYRDEDLACGAAIPEKETTGSVVHEPVIWIDAPADIDDLIGGELSRWRGDIGEGELKAQIEKSRNALTELENALTEIRNQPEPGSGGIGHNNPPGPLVPDLVIDQYVPEIRAVIELHDAPRPNKAAFSRLRDMLGRLRDWLKPRFDIVADSAAEAVGKTIGYGLVVAVGSAVFALGELLKMIF